MAYGAALERRFGATRREFESLPLRHSYLSRYGVGCFSFGAPVQSIHGLVAQRLERLVYIQRVGGSNPSEATISSSIKFREAA